MPIRPVSRNLGTEIREEARTMASMQEENIILRRSSVAQEEETVDGRIRRRRRKKKDVGFRHRNYLSTEHMYNWLDQLASK